MTAKTTTSKPPRIFYFITLLIPLILLGAVETGLRLTGVGSDFPLFIETDEFSGYLYVNPEIIKRYVGNQQAAPNVAPDVTFIKRDKPNGTFRIVVQGGSTAAGFPYGRNASLQGMLNQRFKRLYPDRNIEIVSTAMAAVNSYTLLDLVDEIIQQQPDLVLIYAGHNEYLGVMGVGSRYAASSKRWLTLTIMNARKLRLFQALESLLYRGSPPANADERHTLMSKVVKDATIALKSDQYQAGLKQFRTNLNAVLQRYAAAGIPVLVGNLISNEQDQFPFSSVGDVDWSAYRKTIQETSAAKTIAAIRAKSALPYSAELNYKLGLNLVTAEQFDAARAAFQRARDLDQLRFRAPGEFNEVIQQATLQHNATLVDVETSIRSEAKHALLGSQHLLEHVHPNERGYFMLAEAFVEKIVDSKLLGQSAAPYPASQAWLDNPITRVDRLRAAHMIEKLLNDYPFVTVRKEIPPPPIDTLEGEALSVQESGIDWRDYRLELVRRYQQQGNITEAARVAAGTSDALVTDAMLASRAGQLYLDVDDYTMARYYFQRSTRLAQNNRQAWLGLAEAHFKLGQRDKSEQIMLMLQN